MLGHEFDTGHCPLAALNASQVRSACDKSDGIQGILEHLLQDEDKKALM